MAANANRRRRRGSVVGMSIQFEPPSDEEMTDPVMDNDLEEKRNHNHRDRSRPELPQGGISGAPINEEMDKWNQVCDVPVNDLCSAVISLAIQLECDPNTAQMVQDNQMQLMETWNEVQAVLTTLETFLLLRVLTRNEEWREWVEATYKAHWMPAVNPNNYIDTDAMTIARRKLAQGILQTLVAMKRKEFESTLIQLEQIIWREVIQFIRTESVCTNADENAFCIEHWPDEPPVTATNILAGLKTTFERSRVAWITLWLNNLYSTHQKKTIASLQKELIKKFPWNPEKWSSILFKLINEAYNRYRVAAAVDDDDEEI